MENTKNTNKETANKETKKGANTMENTKKETKNTNKEKGIINTNLATVKRDALFKHLATALENIQTYALEVGVIASYLNGVTIPSYTTKNGAYVPSMHGDKMSITDIVNHPNIEGYSRSTISRMVGAVRRLTNDNKLQLFLTTDEKNRLPFTYDKIYLYYDNIETMKNNNINSLEEAFKKSVRELKDIVNPSTDSSDKSDDEEMVNFTYNRKTYSVKKSAMDTFLKSCVEIKRGNK